MVQNLPHIESQIHEQELYLIHLLNFLDTQIQKLPDGRLRIQQRPGNVDYYWCNKGKKIDYHGVYISRKNKELITSLAQKNYYEKSRKVANSMLKALQNCSSTYNESDLDQVFYTLSPERKKLVSPLYLSDTDYADLWRTVQYEGKNDFAEDWNLYSMRGEPMRSKSEIMLAGIFDKYDVPYRYEFPVSINGKIFHPDFLLLNKRTRQEYIWEHFGMIGTAGYADNCVSKIDIYAKNGYLQGINAIYTFETSERSISTETYEIFVKKYLL